MNLLFSSAPSLHYSCSELLLLLLLVKILSPLCRVFTHIFLRQTMSLGNTRLQLFCRYCLWFIIIIIIIIIIITEIGCKPLSLQSNRRLTKVQSVKWAFVNAKMYRNQMFCLVSSVMDAGQVYLPLCSSKL
jgi:hypothetical protein